MKKRTKIWVIIAVCLVAIGCAVFAGAMACLKWDFTALSTSTIETASYDVSENFDNIVIDANTADISFFLSKDGKCTVVCHEKSNEKHNVYVDGDTLTVQAWETGEWRNGFMDFGEAHLEIYLPEAKYDELIICTDTGDVRIPAAFTFGKMNISASTADIVNFACAEGDVIIRTSTGDITAENMSAAAMRLSASTGDIKVSSVNCTGDINIGIRTGYAVLSDVTCENIASEGTTGDITLRNTVAAGKIRITRNTGDVAFDASDAADIFVETSTGDVSGSFITGKLFDTRTNTGDVSVVSSKDGGTCEIVTDTGDIFIN